jgi:TonB family protein
MKQYFQLVLLSMLSGVFFALTRSAFAQTATQSETPQTGVVMTKLSPPVYPPLARQARIMGDVKIDLRIRQNGSVESAALFSGHPMLAPAALDSAQKSQFECRGCTISGTSYSMTYTFGFRNDGGCMDVVEERAVRSPKCLYLWKCGVRSFSTWHRPENLPPEVTQSPGRVTILASSTCVEVDSAQRR